MLHVEQTTPIVHNAPGSIFMIAHKWRTNPAEVLISSASVIEPASWKSIIYIGQHGRKKQFWESQGCTYDLYEAKVHPLDQLQYLK